MMSAKVKQFRGQTKALVPIAEQERREASKMELKLAIDDEAFQRPPREETDQLNVEVWDIMQQRINAKQSAAQPKNLPKAPGAPEYVKYKPSESRMVHNSGAKARVIQMQELPQDPLDPPKFRTKKVPKMNDTDQAPVLHSPPRPVTQEERKEWQIPPCISNWKNPKGYTIPLDKRLAADGRGLVQQTLNDKQAALAEALYVAESNARKQIEIAQQIKQAQAQQLKKKKEEQLREVAMQARREKKEKMSLQGRLGGDVGAPSDQPTMAEQPAEMGLPGLAGAPPLGTRESGGQAYRGEQDNGHDDDDSPPKRETREERLARKEREDIRYERKREREREHRLEAKYAHGNKKSKLTRDRERDVSERVALGMANVQSGNPDSLYDTRLFNQDQGVGSGLNTDDAYNIYDKAWQADRSQLYKAARVGEGERGGFRPDKGFEGADYDNAGTRDGPVEFEKGDDDVFGLDEFLKNVQQ